MVELVNTYNKEIENKSIKEIFYIKQKEKNYRLIMILSLYFICFDILEIDESAQSYEITLNLEQIKKDHKAFSEFDSLEEFKKIIKDNLDKNEIIITKRNENIIRFELKKNSVFFELTKKKNNVEGLLNNLNIEISKNNELTFELKNNYTKENNNLKQKIIIMVKNNKMLIEENKNLKEENNTIKKDKEILLEENKKLNDKIKYMEQKEKEFNNILIDETKKQEKINQKEKLKNEEINPIFNTKNKIWNMEETFRKNKEKISKNLEDFIDEPKYKKYDDYSKNNIFVIEDISKRNQKGIFNKINIRHLNYLVNKQKNLDNHKNNTDPNLFNESSYATSKIPKINRGLFQNEINNNRLLKLNDNNINSYSNRLSKNNPNNVEELDDNVNIETEKSFQKLSELEEIRNIIQEMDETKKNNGILNKENKKLKEEIKYIKEENIIQKQEINNKEQEILNLKQEVQEKRNYIEKLKNEEVNPLWNKTLSFKRECEKMEQIYISIYQDINQIISENEKKNKNYKCYYKIAIFEQKENSIDTQRGRNINNKTGYDFYRKRNLSRNPTESNLSHKYSLENILEESEESNLFQKRIQTDYNMRDGEKIKSNEKALIKKENNTINIMKNKIVARKKNYNTITTKINKNELSKFNTPTKVNNKRLSSYSEKKIKYNQSLLYSPKTH